MVSNTTFRLFASQNSSFVMLDFLFAMVLAAALCGVASCFGCSLRSGGGCPDEGGIYSVCAVWEDFKLMLSFLFGASTCLFSTGHKQDVMVDTTTQEGSAECTDKSMRFMVCLW
eukprot:TRINITY_DN42907_c0_g1_i1.p1 TRINITY_DN42907_c0_g1~~TRINITY_DN42907_c0_g1_i1.p1  ORF type:complete len:114 (+),score=17.61 TRINITY_DN42907_c0_g1_i1:89-430(+)